MIIIWIAVLSCIVAVVVDLHFINLILFMISFPKSRILGLCLI